MCTAFKWFVMLLEWGWSISWLRNSGTVTSPRSLHLFNVYLLLKALYPFKSIIKCKMQYFDSGIVMLRNKSPIGQTLDAHGYQVVRRCLVLQKRLFSF